MNPDWLVRSETLAKGLVIASQEIAALLSEKGLLARVGTAISPATVVTCLEQFQECVRYLNTRRSKYSLITISSEDDVQDLIFLMLRPTILDLIPENPLEKTAGRYVIQDFLTKELKVVVEAKFIRDQKHGREITKELHDDIEMYRIHPNCSFIIFFIYDRNALIPDVRSLKEQIEGVRDYNGKHVQVFCVIKP